VEGAGKRDPEAQGVRFSVTLDRREVFSRLVNPAAKRRDRRWFDERIDLPAAAGREVEIGLRTELVGPGSRSAGVPGWSLVRIVRETWQERQRSSAEAPNVLVLLVDTLRADPLGCYGAAPSASPTLDRLAGEGLVFDRAVAQSSWTLPSVASIFTGLHARSHGVGVGRGDTPTRGAYSDWAFLPDALPTLSGQAQAAGITTVAVVGNWLISRGTNFARGFESFVEFRPDGTHRVVARASEINAAFLRWLRHNADKRFLAYLHYIDPHAPYAPPDGFRPLPPAAVRPKVAAGEIDTLKKTIDGSRGVQLPPHEASYLRALYDAEIRYWDTELGRLLDALASFGLRESTVLVVTADHGEEFQEHGRLGHGMHLYEELLRVPLVIAGPSIGRGRIHEQAQGIDLFPTVAALLGLAVPPGLPGQNLLGAHEERPAFSETRYWSAYDGTDTPIVSLRTAGWKLIHAPLLGRYELYDLVHDTAERDDRFGSAAEGAALVRLLDRWWAAAPAPPPPSGSDPAIREKLRALGYVD
jgi:arylsulfatase A-like enzyme